MNNNLLETLRHLEVELHQPDTRSNVKRLDALLHRSFIEFGRSGKTYNKAEILKQLPSESSQEAIWSQDYSMAEISEEVALLTYKSAHLSETGELTRHTNRSSLWQKTAAGWQIRFHQGTATARFSADTPSL